MSALSALLPGFLAVLLEPERPLLEADFLLPQPDFLLKEDLVRELCLMPPQELLPLPKPPPRKPLAKAISGRMMVRLNSNQKIISRKPFFETCMVFSFLFSNERNDNLSFFKTSFSYILNNTHRCVYLLRNKSLMRIYRSSQ